MFCTPIPEGNQTSFRRDCDASSSFTAFEEIQLKEIRPHLEGIATHMCSGSYIQHRVKEIRPHLEGIATLHPLNKLLCMTLKEIRPHLEGIATRSQKRPCW